MITTEKPIIAIVGPTATGKTALSMALARRFNGEIICADSRTIYQEMDIGTAKPSPEDCADIPHYLLDMIKPTKTYSAADFKTAAEKCLATIVGHERLPIIVGGSGLYIYGLLYGYQFPAGGSNELRAQLESLPLPILVERLQQEDPEAARHIDLQNPRRVIRALETVGQPRVSQPRLKSNILLVGLNPDRETLNKNITQRTDTMLQIGLVDEVRRIVENYGPRLEVLRSPGYAEIIDFIAGRVTLEEAREQIILHTRQLARRQYTWLKRNPEIQWFENQDDAETFVTQWLKSYT